MLGRKDKKGASAASNSALNRATLAGQWAFQILIIHGQIVDPDEPDRELFRDELGKCLGELCD
mgnify:CR=1 FL=1